MEEKKFVNVKKEEFRIKEYVKKVLGKGKISDIDIGYTPIGEKIIVSTSKPGLVIGRKGERILELTENLKKKFSLENPSIEIQEIKNPLFDAQTVADKIALSIERSGPIKFKVIAYRMLEEIVKGGAKGVEIRLSGKLPSERSRTWRFASGYLKKTGETKSIVDRAKAIAKTHAGIVGVKVSIVPPDAEIEEVKIKKDMEERDGDIKK